jgi:hypothetical protein
MAKKLTRMAIAYDFDGTLAPGNMQEHSFIPQLGLSVPNFWTEVKANASKQDMDEILAYMQMMLKKAAERNIPVRLSDIRNHGKDITFFPGVETWFGRLNTYAREKGIKLEHYIISSGLREMIDGTRIGKEFTYVFASGFSYNANNVAEWPALAVNYTNKTQYLFRINKGIQNSYDNKTINQFIPGEKRPIPFSNIAYIGDGETDIPCMKMLKYQGGTSVAVYNASKRKTKSRRSAKEIAEELIEHGRADYAFPADYTDGSRLDALIKGLIDRVAVNASIQGISSGNGSVRSANATTASFDEAGAVEEQSAPDERALPAAN